MMNNILIQGENIDGLKYLLNERSLAGKVDLVYIDPPFATNCKFTITNGRATTISNSNSGEVAYTDNLLGQDFVEYIKARLLMIKEFQTEAPFTSIQTIKSVII